MKNLEHKGSFWDGLDKDSIRYNIYHPKDMKSTPETKEEKVKTLEKEIVKEKITENINKNKYIYAIVILLGGYFAYKKFKK